MKVKYKVLTIIAICMMTTACEKSNNAIEYENGRDFIIAIEAQS